MAQLDLVSQFSSRLVAHWPHRRDRAPYNPWPRALVWLLGLGALLLLSRHPAMNPAMNPAMVSATAPPQLGGGLIWAREHGLPLLPWSVVPYLSIGLFGALSFVVCTSARATDRHGLRLLTALLIGLLGLLTGPEPVGIAVGAPMSAGLPGLLLAMSGAFDLPGLQLPALPVALLVLVRAQFGMLRMAPVWRLLLNLWALLAALSALTTGQHHLIGLISGAALGLLCLWLWPNPPLRSPLRREALAPHARAARLRLALLGLSGALLAASLARTAGFGATMLLLAWSALALGLVAWSYAWCGASGFQQDSRGRQSHAATWLLAPVTLVARLSAWLWTWGRRSPVPIAANVWVGPLPSVAELHRPPEGVPVFQTLCSLSAELVVSQATVRPEGTTLKIVARPWLDLVPASGQELLDAAHEIDYLRRGGPLLVACGRGASRSAAVLAVWLHMHGQAGDTESAARQLQDLLPHLKLDDGWRAALSAAEALMHTGATQPAPLRARPPGALRPHDPLR